MFVNDYEPAARWECLKGRAELLRRLRAFFFDRGFVEIETPILSADTVVDRHLDPFRVDVSFDGGKTSQPFWMQTSPEFHLKRLLATPASHSSSPPEEKPSAIFGVARVFRRDEIGPLHNPEFTMVEWYRVGDGMREGMDFTSDLIDFLLPRGAAERLSFRDAFVKYAAVDPLTIPTAELIAAVHRQDIFAPESLSPDDRDGWLDLLLVEKVQPKLGFSRPTLLYDFPASQAALSLVRKDDPPVAERFELYIDGIELANGYHELLDADELRRRNKTTNILRLSDGKDALPEESRLLAAMAAGMPACTGVALGFDRLAMIALGAKTLADVLAFPFDRA